MKTQITFPLSSADIDMIEATALNEGWVFGQIDLNDGQYVFAVSRYDMSEAFTSDEGALVFVQRLADMGSSIHQMAVAAHMQPIAQVKGYKGQIINAKIIIDITYSLPEGMKARELDSLLNDNINSFIGNGGLTGDTEASVELHDATISVEGV